VTRSIAPFKAFALVLFGCAFVLPSSSAQQSGQAAKPGDKAPQASSQIELLETHVRFAADGSSRKEVHTRVHINDDLGAHEFSRLSFGYNRAFEQIEIPSTRITHPSGGVADILPSAISDQPSPAVANAPALQDIRVKSVRILGLAPGDTLEYRIVTTTSHHPLAPDFWFDHSFDRSGVVSHEIFELDLPASRQVQMRIDPATPASSTDKSGEGDSARSVYRWDLTTSNPKAAPLKDANSSEPQVVFTTFSAWEDLANKLTARVVENTPSPEVASKAEELSHSSSSPQEKLHALYDFVSQKIHTLDLPLGTTAFRVRPSAEILASGYALAEEKCALLTALATSLNLSGEQLEVAPALIISSPKAREEIARPAAISTILVVTKLAGKDYWLDPSTEVAPFGMISAGLREKFAIALRRGSKGDGFTKVSSNLPFPASQKVDIDATLTVDGTLNAKVKYVMRGDNELLLRLAFHQAARDRWKDVAQLLAISDGFRGKIVSATASDPAVTRDPFTVEYELTQPKFVDWTKSPVRIPALLPLLGLPDQPARTAGSNSAEFAIELGTPLEVEARATLHLPASTSAEVPTGTSVDRAYASFSSQYTVQDGVVTATRHIHFIQRQVPAAQGADYNAFVHAVQADQSQRVVLTRPK
jgi:hypothetical protein